MPQHAAACSEEAVATSGVFWEGAKGDGVPTGGVEVPLTLHDGRQPEIPVRRAAVNLVLCRLADPTSAGAGSCCDGGVLSLGPCLTAVFPSTGGQAP